MRSLIGAGAHGNEVLRHCTELPLEEGIGVVGVPGKCVSVDLTLSCDKAIQQGNADAAVDVANRAADAGDLVDGVGHHSPKASSANPTHLAFLMTFAGVGLRTNRRELGKQG